MGRADKRLKRKQSAFALGTARRRGGARSQFLDQRVPLAASLTLTLPAVEGCPAVLTDEARCATGHLEPHWRMFLTANRHPPSGRARGRASPEHALSDTIEAV